MLGIPPPTLCPAPPTPDGPARPWGLSSAGPVLTSHRVRGPPGLRLPPEEGGLSGAAAQVIQDPARCGSQGDPRQCQRAALRSALEGMRARGLCVSYMNTHMCACVPVHVWVHTCVHVLVHACVCAQAHVPVCVRVCALTSQW